MSYKMAYSNGNSDGIDRLYRIYIKNGIAYVDTLSVIEPLSKQAWYQSLVVGQAKDASIELNGFWTRDDTTQIYTLTTEEKPWIFWIGTDDNLYAQIWDDTSTTMQMATGVTKLATLRGWKNVYMWNHDQGLIVAYIKTDGKVYYRNYCKQPPDQPAIWEGERLIDVLPYPCTDIALFRTNDYRTGFMAVSNGTTYWTVTERDYAGMSVPIERVTVSPAEVSIDFVQIDYFNACETENIISSPEVNVALGYVLTDNHFTDIHNESVTINGTEDWGKVLIVRTENDLHNLSAGDFEIIDSKNATYFPDTVEQIGDRTYKLSYLDTNNFNNVDKQGTMKFLGLTTTNDVGTVYQPFEKVFYPTNLVPTAIPLPEVSVIWNE